MELKDTGSLALPVANTTMETYVQSLTCMTCHVHAAVADDGSSATHYASDFSFLFGEAQSPPASVLLRSRRGRTRRSLPKDLVQLPH